MIEEPFLRAIAKGKINRATKILDDIREELPRKRELFLDGKLLEVKGEYKEALKKYDMALVLHLSDENLWLAKANVLVKIGKLDIAKRAADRACKLSDQKWEAHLLCATILYKLKEYQNSLEQIDIAIKHGARSAEALTLKGILISILEQDYHQALMFFDNAIEADEKYGRAWTNRGMALKQIGDRDGALYSFQRALMIDQNDRNARKMIKIMGNEEVLKEKQDDDELEWD